jgi:hypothetical protein
MARVFRSDQPEETPGQFGQFALRGRIIEGQIPDDPDWQWVAAFGPASPDDTYVVLTIPQYEAAQREAAAREREACAQIAADECMANRGLLAHLPTARECALTAHTIYTRIQSRARADDAAGGDGGNG